jgi:cytochrome c2
MPDPGRSSGATLACVALAAGLGLAGAISAWLAATREREADALAARLTGGDPRRGPAVALQHGCAGCHAIPGLRGPGGRVGPPLADVGARLYLAGRLANTPENLIRWIENPRAVDPQTAMPTTGISKREARDMAAFLLTAR